MTPGPAQTRVTLTTALRPGAVAVLQVDVAEVRGAKQRVRARFVGGRGAAPAVVHDEQLFRASGTRREVFDVAEQRVVVGVETARAREVMAENEEKDT